MVHATPPFPQAALVSPGWHFPLRQQPSGHVDGVQLPLVHSPLVQVSPDPQTRQRLPSLPQADARFPDLHWPVRQQPVQVEGPHEETHFWPVQDSLP